jgi:hypothetical protein
MDMTIANITMRNLIASPLFMRLGARMRTQKSGNRDAEADVDFRYCGGEQLRLIPRSSSGIPGSQIEDIKIRNMFIEHEGGGTKEMATLKPLENEKDYPEHSMFGDVIPAQGFFLRHIKNIEMSDIEIRSQKPDLRPPFLLNDVNGADFWHVKANVPVGMPMFSLADVSDFAVSRSRPVKDAEIDRVAGEMSI